MNDSVQIRRVVIDFICLAIGNVYIVIFILHPLVDPKAQY
jgi:hypothetical protein